MTNNAINNVPRELLERVLDYDGAVAIRQNARHELRAILSAPSPANHVEDVRAMVADPSPAGVDGLEVVGWYRMDDRKAITPYPSVCATWHKMGVKVGAAYSDSAHAIIDGLRGENHQRQRELRLRQSQIESSGRIAERAQRFAVQLRTERDQQAQRIGELEGLLLDCENAFADIGADEWCERIDAALSAGKEGE